MDSHECIVARSSSAAFKSIREYQNGLVSSLTLAFCHHYLFIAANYESNTSSHTYSSVNSLRFDNGIQNSKNLKVYGKKSNSFIGSTGGSSGITAGSSSIGTVFTRYTHSLIHWLRYCSFTRNSSSKDVIVKPLQFEDIIQSDTSTKLTREDSVSSVQSTNGVSRSKRIQLKQVLQDIDANVIQSSSIGSTPLLYSYSTHSTRLFLFTHSQKIVVKRLYLNVRHDLIQLVKIRKIAKFERNHLLNDAHSPNRTL